MAILTIEQRHDLGKALLFCPSKIYSALYVHHDFRTNFNNLYTMELKQLKKSLQQGLTADTCDQLKDALCSTSLSPVAASQNALFIIRTISHNYNQDNIVDLSFILSLTRQCSQCVNAHWVQTPDGMTIQRPLYHLADKLFKQGCLDAGCEVSMLIYTHSIQDYRNLLVVEMSPQIAYRMFVSIWNACLQTMKISTPQRKQGRSAPSSVVSLNLYCPMDCLKVRLLALKFIAISDKPMELFMEKTQTSISKFESSIAVQNQSNSQPHITTSQKLLSITTAMDTLISVLVEKQQYIIASCEDGAQRTRSLCFDLMQLQTLFTSHIQTYMNSTDKTQVIKSITKVRGFVKEHMQDLKILRHYNLISDIQEQVLVACCSATGIKQLNSMLSMLFKVCDNLKDVTALNELKDGLDFKILALLSSVCVIYCQQVENVCKSELETYSKDEKARTSSNDAKQMSLTPLVTDLIQGHIGLCDCTVKMLMCLLRLEEKNSESCQWRSSLIKLRAARLKSFVSEIRYVGCNKKRDLLLVRNRDGMLSDLNVLQSDINNVTNVDKGKQPATEIVLLQFANITQKLFKFYHNHESYDTCIKLMTLHIKELGRYHKLYKNNKQQLQFTNKYDLLSECHLRMGQHSLAMETIARCLYVENCDLVILADKWVKIKLDLKKHRPQSALLKRTLSECLLKKAAGDITAKTLMSVELKACRQNKGNTYAYELDLVTQLLSLHSTDSEHALLCVQMAQLLWAMGDTAEPLPLQDNNSDAASYCSKSLSLLSSDTDLSPTDTSTKAKAHLWTYIIRDIDPTKKKQLNLASSTSNSVPLPLSDTSDGELYSDVYTIAQETEAMAHLHEALLLWQSLVQSGQEWLKHGGQTEGKNWWSDLGTEECDNITLLASIYKLSNKTEYFLQSALVCSFFASMCKQSPDRYVSAQTLVIQAYCDVEHYHLARQVATHSDEWIQKQKPINSAATMTAYKIAKAQICLGENKLLPGLTTLEAAMNYQSSHLKEGTKEAMILQAQLKHLQARFKSLACPDGDEPIPLYTDSHGLDLHMFGIRCINSVVCHVLGKHLLSYTSNETKEEDKERKNTDSVLDRWLILEVLLTSLLSTGRMHMISGEVREATCYLQQGLKISHALCLPRRFAQFHLLLAELEVLLNRSDHCLSHLNAAQYALNTTLVNTNVTDKLLWAQRTQSSETNSINNSQPIKGIDQNKMANENEEFSLASHTLSLLQQNEDMDNSNDHSRPCTSPKLSRKLADSNNVTLEFTPGCWTHVQTCRCTSCRDISLHRIGMNILCIKALQEQLGNDSNESGDAVKMERYADAGNVSKLFWHTFLTSFDAVSGRMFVMLHEMSSVSSLFSNINLTIKPSMYQSVLARCCLDLMDYAVRVRNKSLYSEWSSKAIEMLDYVQYPWMGECSEYRAKLHLLQAQYEFKLLSHPPIKSPDTIVAAVAHKLITMSIGKKTDEQNKICYKTPGPILARSRLTSKGSVNFAMEETDKDSNDAQDLLAAPKKLKAPVPPRMVKPRSAEENPSKKTSSTKRVTIVTGNSKKAPCKPTRKLKNSKLPPPTVTVYIDDQSQADKVKATPRNAKLSTNRKTSYKTPITSSTHYRKAMLDYLLLDSDSDDDFQPSSEGIVLSAKKSVERVSRLRRTPIISTPKQSDSKSTTQMSTVVDLTATDEEEWEDATPLRPAHRNPKRRNGTKNTLLELPATHASNIQCEEEDIVDAMQHLSIANGKENKSSTTTRLRARSPSPFTDRAPVMSLFTGSKQDSEDEDQKAPKTKSTRGRKASAKAKTIDVDTKKCTTKNTRRKPATGKRLVKSASDIGQKDELVYDFNEYQSEDEENAKPRTTKKTVKGSKVKSRKTAVKSDSNDEDYKPTVKTSNTRAKSTRVTRAAKQLKETSRNTPSLKGTNGITTINNSFNIVNVMPPDELFDILSDESLHESLYIADDSVIIPAEHEAINVVENQKNNLSPVYSEFRQISDQLLDSLVLANQYAAISTNHNAANLIKHHPELVHDLSDIRRSPPSTDSFDNTPRVVPCGTGKQNRSSSQVRIESFTDEPMEIARGPVTKPVDSLSSSHHAGKSLINQRREQNSDVEHPRRDSNKSGYGSDEQSHHAMELSGDSPTVTDDNQTEHEHGSIDVMEKHLMAAFNSIKLDPPAVEYRSICHMLGRLYNNRYEDTSPHCTMKSNGTNEDLLRAAFYYSEAQSVTFRHSAMLNISRKLRRRTTNASKASELSTEDNNVEMESSDARWIEAKDMLAFNKDITHVETVTKQLPQGCSVCQFSVLESMNSRQPDQLICLRLTHGQAPIIQTLNGYISNNAQNVLQQFDYILQSNKATFVLTDIQEWWKKRIDLDNTLKQVLEDMECYFLGCWKSLLLGDYAYAKHVEKLEELTEEVTNEIKNYGMRVTSEVKLKYILSCTHSLSDAELVHGLSEVTTFDLDNDDLYSCIEIVRSLHDRHDLEDAPRHPTILILDKCIQHLSWESMPILRTQSVTRMPSIHFLYAQLCMLEADPSSTYQTGINLRNTYYVLNPDDDLNHSQKTLQQKFSTEEGWTGIIGKKPTSAQYTEAITKHDLFIYCGHGSGTQYLSVEEIRRLSCRSVPLLMGCSSGRLKQNHKLEASGTVLQYFMAGCPCMVANLWEVTDRDIDKYLLNLLDNWRSAAKQSQDNHCGFHVESASILRAVSSSRNICKLPYLNGAAPVVYGLPITLNHTE